jgi:hypothetical protein
VVVNEANHAINVVIIKPLSVLISWKIAYVYSLDLPTLKDNNFLELLVFDISPNMVINLVKEERNSNSSHIPINHHSWGSAIFGKGGSNITCEVC